MKRAARAAALLAALALLPTAVAQAHPGHGPDSVMIDGDAFKFTPPFLRVGVGDTVIWFWDGTLFRNHSVTSTPGQAEQFDSDPTGFPTNASHPDGSTFSHVFRRKGTFTYYCKVHPNMRGTIEVVEVPDPVPGPPRIRGLKVSDGPRVLARFKLSERADVVGRIARRVGRRWKPASSFSVRGRQGKNRVRVPTSRLGRGIFRLELVAYDLADKRSKPVDGRFRLGR